MIIATRQRDSGTNSARNKGKKRVRSKNCEHDQRNDTHG